MYSRKTTYTTKFSKIDQVCIKETPNSVVITHWKIAPSPNNPSYSNNIILYRFLSKTVSGRILSLQLQWPSSRTASKNDTS